MKSDDSVIEEFLNRIKIDIANKNYTLVPRRDGINNLLRYGLTIDDMEKFMCSLLPKNYQSGPDSDRNHEGEYVWIFKSYMEGIGTIYIKCQYISNNPKLRIISFHPDR